MADLGGVKEASVLAAIGTRHASGRGVAARLSGSGGGRLVVMLGVSGGVKDLGGDRSVSRDAPPHPALSPSGWGRGQGEGAERSRARSAPLRVAANRHKVAGSDTRI
jgi:hypothetical protein